MKRYHIFKFPDKGLGKWFCVDRHAYTPIIGIGSTPTFAMEDAITKVTYHNAKVLEFLDAINPVNREGKLSTQW